MRDRQVLASELEFLRRNISKNTQAEVDTFISSNRRLVDEVMGNVRTDAIEKTDHYVTGPKSKAGGGGEDRLGLWYIAET